MGGATPSRRRRRRPHVVLCRRRRWSGGGVASTPLRRCCASATPSPPTPASTAPRLGSAPGSSRSCRSAFAAWTATTDERARHTYLASSVGGAAVVDRRGAQRARLVVDAPHRAHGRRWTMSVARRRRAGRAPRRPAVRPAAADPAGGAPRAGPTRRHRARWLVRSAGPWRVALVRPVTVPAADLVGLTAHGPSSGWWCVLRQRLRRTTALRNAYPDAIDLVVVGHPRRSAAAHRAAPRQPTTCPMRCDRRSTTSSSGRHRGERFADALDRAAPIPRRDRPADGRFASPRPIATACRSRRCSNDSPTRPAPTAGAPPTLRHASCPSAWPLRWSSAPAVVRPVGHRPAADRGLLVVAADHDHPSPTGRHLGRDPTMNRLLLLALRWWRSLRRSRPGHHRVRPRHARRRARGPARGRVGHGGGGAGKIGNLFDRVIDSVISRF